MTIPNWTLIDAVVEHIHKAHHTETIETSTYNIYIHKDSDGNTTDYDVLHKQ